MQVKNTMNPASYAQHQARVSQNQYYRETVRHSSQPPISARAASVNRASYFSSVDKRPRSQPSFSSHAQQAKAIDLTTRQFQNLSLQAPSREESSIENTYSPLIGSVYIWTQKMRGLKQCWKEVQIAFKQFRKNWKQYPHCHAEFAGRRPAPMNASTQPIFVSKVHQKMWDCHNKFVEFLLTNEGEELPAELSPSSYPFTQNWNGQEWISGWTPLLTE